MVVENGCVKFTCTYKAKCIFFSSRCFASVYLESQSPRSSKYSNSPYKKKQTNNLLRQISSRVPLYQNILKNIFLSYPSRFCIFESKTATVWQSHIKPFPQQQILYSSKLKDTADNDFKFEENGGKCSSRVENSVGKGEIAQYDQFLLFPQCFQKTCIANMANKALFGKVVFLSNTFKLRKI